jgi:hypothetical protein
MWPKGLETQWGMDPVVPHGAGARWGPWGGDPGRVWSQWSHAELGSSGAQGAGHLRAGNPPGNGSARSHVELGPGGSPGVGSLVEWSSSIGGLWGGDLVDQLYF